jgi:hypothetical protein
MRAAAKKVLNFHNLNPIWVLLTFALCACSQGKPISNKTGRITNYTECVLPSDQGEGSFMASWASLPISVVIDKDFYVTDGGLQAYAIKNAINTWNAWGSLRGFTVFNLTEDGTGVTAGRVIPPLADNLGCQQSIFTDYANDGVVGIWKIRSGGDGRNNRGSCNLFEPDATTGVGAQGQTDWVVTDGHTTKASILLNFVDYNVPGKETVDLESLALHELGHVLGLLHSCNPNPASDGTSSPLCSAAPSKYIEAVMFPFLGNSQLRRKLKQNDYDRVNCLY